MTIPGEWRQQYGRLRDFVAACSDITISESEMSIPQGIREQFYLLFDDIRRTVVEAHYSLLAGDLGALSNNYKRMEAEAKELLRLTDIRMPAQLLRFLRDPRDGLHRAIYQLTCDLVQGKTTPDAYEEQVVRVLEKAATELFRLGYELWAALTLIVLLEPDEGFRVELDSDDRPALAQLKDIWFGRQTPHPTIRLPEFVLHSRRIGRYVAIKMELAREADTYAIGLKPVEKPKKQGGDTAYFLEPRVMLFYFLQGIEEIPVIADIYDRTMTRPDWMVDFITRAEFEEPEALQFVNCRHHGLNPRCGTCLVFVDCDRDIDPGKMISGIHSISPAFDRFKLAAAIDSQIRPA